MRFKTSICLKNLGTEGDTDSRKWTVMGDNSEKQKYVPVLKLLHVLETTVSALCTFSHLILTIISDKHQDSHFHVKEMAFGTNCLLTTEFVTVIHALNPMPF